MSSTQAKPFRPVPEKVNKTQMPEHAFIHEPGTPTVVLLHGTGGTEAEMLEFGHELSPNSGLLSIRGKEIEGQKTTRWFQRLSEGVFDIPNLMLRTKELADFVKTYPGPRVAVGFSNGANIAASVLLTDPDAFDAAILFAAMLPHRPEMLPDLSGTKVVLVAGQKDPIVPPESVQSLADLLQEAKAEVELRWHPAGHQIPHEEFVYASTWITKHYPA